MRKSITKVCLFTSMLVMAGISSRAQDFSWAKQVAGPSQSEEGKGIGLDAMGNVYSAGVFDDSADLDPGPGTQMAYSAGGDDIYVQKLDAMGNLIWAFSIGGTSTDVVHDLYTDLAGNVYITGQFKNTVDFDPDTGVTNLVALANDDIFFAKYNSSGALVWAHRIGGTANDQGHGITADLSGNVYITGYFKGIVDFDPGPGTANLTGNGIEDIFVAKYDSSGNYLWAHSAGGANTDMGQSIAVDYMGNVLVTGNFNGAAVDFDPGPATVNLSTNGGADIFIASYGDTGQLNWAKNIGSDSTDDGLGIATDIMGNVFVTGYFQDSADFDPGPGTQTLTATGDKDIYILNLDGSGNFVWAKQVGGTGADAGNDINIDISGGIYVTGYFSGFSVDFDPDTGITNLTGHGNEDIFVAKYDSVGSLSWARSMGSSATDMGNAIITDIMGDVYSTGLFKGICDFDPNAGVFNLTAISNQDAYVQKLILPIVSVPNSTTVNAKAFPNPVRDNVNIELDKVYPQTDISLTDITGKVLMERTSLNARSFRLNMVGLTTGVYFLNVRTGSGRSMVRLVKE
jgi:hypothetical protein